MPMPKRRACRSGSSQCGGRSASHRQPASTTARTTAVTGGRLTAVAAGWARWYEGYSARK